MSSPHPHPYPYPFISLLLYTSARGRIAIGDLLDKLHVWVIQHDMEMLKAFDRLQRRQILEPGDLAQELASSKL